MTPVARPRWEIGRNTAFIVLLHAIPLVAIVQGPRRVDWLVCVALYVLALIGAGLGLHRYFAHRAFRTSRAFQLVLAVLGCTGFTDPIGFAGKHRLHHQHADREGDVHNPRDGFWFCWYGSLIDEAYPDERIVAMARDWARFPELRWLHRFFALPALAAGALVWWLGGFSMFAIGFCLSRVFLLNASSGVNFFCHRQGGRRFATPDRSTNHVVLALLTLGEGWHNNHHHYPRAARSGLRWWELDPLYYVVRLLAALGLVWDVREVPDPVRQVMPERSHWRGRLATLKGHEQLAGRRADHGPGQPLSRGGLYRPPGGHDPRPAPGHR